MLNKLNASRISRSAAAVWLAGALAARGHHQPTNRENAFLVAKYAGNVIIVIISPARCCCCDAVTASVPLDSKAGALAQPVLHAILHIAYAVEEISFKTDAS